MNWRFKLSIRLALLRGILLGAGALAGCSASATVAGTSAASLPDSTSASLLGNQIVKTIVLSPATLSVSVGATRQIVATMRNAAGQIVYGRTPTWTSSAPAVASVSTVGIVTARTGGQSTITAAIDGVSARAVVTVTGGTVVTPPPASVATVTLSPATVSLTPGATVQLAATVRDSSGSLLAGSIVTWQSGTTAVAAVSTSGLVSGVAAGTASVTATSGGKSATASVTVTPPVVPPPGGTFGGNINEPAGLTLISTRMFDAKIESGWLDRGDAAFSIQPDAAAPLSPGSVGQALFRAGMAGGSGPINVRREINTLNYHTVYLRFPFMVSSNWQGHSTGVNKIFFIWIGAQPRVFFRMMGSGSGALLPRINLQNDPLDVGTLAGNVDATKAIVRGRWHDVEILMQSNTSGNADGIVKLWVDGVLVTSYSNIEFASATESHIWETVSWNPTWGGWGDTVVADMWQRIDSCYISGR